MMGAVLSSLVLRSGQGLASVNRGKRSISRREGSLPQERGAAQSCLASPLHFTYSESDLIRVVFSDTPSRLVGQDDLECV